MLLVCRKKKKIQAFSCKLKQKASLQAFWRRSKLERKKKTVARAIEWQILILLLRLIYWAIYQHGVFHCSEAADEIAARCPVVHALITGLTCPDSWGKEKKKSFSLFLLKSPVVFLKSSVFVTRGRWSMEAAHWKIQSCIIFLSVSPSHLWLSRR